MKILKEQINNQNKEVYVIEKNISYLEHKKEVKDKWNEMKQSVMSKKSKEIASLKKVCFEFQNSIEDLRKQNINLDKEIKKAKVGKENETSYLKISQNKEEALQNSLKRERLQKDTFQKQLKKSEINTIAFNREYMILLNALQNAKNEAASISNKLKNSKNVKELKRHHFMKLQEQQIKVSQSRDAIMANSQDNRVTMHHLQDKIQSAIKKRNSLKNQLAIYTNEKNRRRLLYDKQRNEMSKKTKELEMRTKQKEELNKKFELLLHDINDLQRKVRDKDKEISLVKKSLTQESETTEKLITKLSRLENLLLKLKDQESEECKVLEYTKREIYKAKEDVTWLRLELEQASSGVEVLHVNKESEKELIRHLKDDYITMEEGRSCLDSLEDNIINPKNTDQWKIIREINERKHELEEVNKRLLEYTHQIQMKKMAQNFKMFENEIIQDEVYLLLTGREKNLDIFRNFNETYRLITMKTNQLNGLLTEKNMIYTLLHNEIKVKAELLNKIEVLKNEYFNSKSKVKF
ncbi:GRIP and coiled-coil domain-containing protein PFC0235w-like [Centruroides sculpturatus]|uniref:GRIP and coiled-coil domain-containing protein PFC0235w-like n=1 Tax=Centruroides sculpturatus TaxID=218467 RepID=UPI000C6D2C43|nr:GRIP and coiled-coil domain-containing protein PFC0235w-like [Centruroides sculpturatus]